MARLAPSVRLTCSLRYPKPLNGFARPPVAMPPLSCAHVDVSWMSQNWPSADGTRVTAPMPIADTQAIAAEQTSRALTRSRPVP